MSNVFTITEEMRYGRHSMYSQSIEDNYVFYLPRKIEAMYDDWADKFDDTKVSLRKPRHLRTDSMRYVCDFPEGRDIVLVYPLFGDIIRWVAVKDQYGFDQHESHIFDFHMKFTCPCITCEGE